ncbi:unnamed protein product [Timema podura]|uniref:Uncharacterized protein n=1 Tax=Timema podura TaxID=61482 RepID=A0ABN7NLY7_TIMPD|nr:unnamed protein product [Timema podura]
MPDQDSKLDLPVIGKLDERRLAFSPHAIKCVWYTSLWDVLDVLSDMVDFSHFSDIQFVLFAISNFLLYSWYHVPYVFLTDKAIEMGMENDDASYLISYLGILNMVGEVHVEFRVATGHQVVHVEFRVATGHPVVHVEFRVATGHPVVHVEFRIFLGWAGDQPWINAGVVYAASMAMCGFATMVVPLITSYAGLATVAGIFGFSIAGNYCLASIILVELISLDRFTNAYGLLLLVQGIANLIGPPLADHEDHPTTAQAASSHVVLCLLHQFHLDDLTRSLLPCSPVSSPSTPPPCSPESSPSNPPRRPHKKPPPM